jgi:hypothetical protein
MERSPAAGAPRSADAALPTLVSECMLVSIDGLAAGLITGLLPSLGSEAR